MTGLPWDRDVDLPPSPAPLAAVLIDIARTLRGTHVLTPEVRIAIDVFPVEQIKLALGFNRFAEHRGWMKAVEEIEQVIVGKS